MRVSKVEDNRSNSRANKMECFPCNLKVLSRTCSKHLYIKEVLKPVLRPLNNPRSAPGHVLEEADVNAKQNTRSNTGCRPLWARRVITR